MCPSLANQLDLLTLFYTVGDKKVLNFVACRQINAKKLEYFLAHVEKLNAFCV